ncbi:TatD family hydrolase [Taibaiella soli]|uniref:TatD family hydrolase n=1 Tax=Taibaiella soli TaxID=1649169 RepID=UPI001402F369|nr:TatD family hydrolase [Taibaiella soli]
MSRYINIHSHHTFPGDNLSIFCLYDQFERAESGLTCSVGLHPWYLDHAEADCEAIRKYMSLPNVLAIGECGLDKLAKTDWDWQMKWLIWQIDLANSINKPLIIHCVKAFEDLLAVFKMHPPKVPVIIHGFNKKPELAQQLVQHRLYISFGKALFQSHPGPLEALEHIPADHFFLETDDAAMPIADVYAKAAKIRKTGEDEIILQLQKNFQNVFAR